MEIRSNDQASTNAERRKLAQLKNEASQASQEASRKALDSLKSATAAKSKSMQAEVAHMRDARKHSESEVRRFGDRLELSKNAHIFASEQQRVDDEARTERVAELKQQHEQGKLNTKERIDRAAGKLLGG